MARPEWAWALCAGVGLGCLAMAGFMVSDRVGLLVTGLALLWLVKLGTTKGN